MSIRMCTLKPLIERLWQKGAFTKHHHPPNRYHAALHHPARAGCSWWTKGRPGGMRRCAGRYVPYSPHLLYRRLTKFAVTGVHDLDAYLHSQLLLAALTLSLTLMAPGATLVFKIFLSPLDPRAQFLASQLTCFFSSPLPEDDGEDAFGQYEEFDESVGDTGRQDDKEEKTNQGREGYDPQGRRGGVWVRKPRSSRQGSAGTFNLPFSTIFLIDHRGQRRSSSAATFHPLHSRFHRHSPPRRLTHSGPPPERSPSIPSPLSSPKAMAKVETARFSKEVKSK